MWVDMKITKEQCKAGRALADWSQDRLASESNLGLSTIRDFEKGRREPHPNNLTAIRTALESAGVEFIDENGGGPGVRLRKG
jgi:transcriptional regulator with XRE-family HTH domain